LERVTFYEYYLHKLLLFINTYAIWIFNTSNVGRFNIIVSFNIYERYRIMLRLNQILLLQCFFNFFFQKIILINISSKTQSSYLREISKSHTKFVWHKRSAWSALCHKVGHHCALGDGARSRTDISLHIRHRIFSFVKVHYSGGYIRPSFRPWPNITLNSLFLINVTTLDLLQKYKKYHMQNSSYY